MNKMSKFEKTIVNILIVLAIMILTSVLVRCEDKHRDKIDYRTAGFVYNEEILCYRELVQEIDDYQFEVYNDTVLIGESVRSQIDYLERQLDSIYSVN